MTVRVLIADDELDILDSTRELLELEGYEVEAVQTANRVLPAIEQSRPHVLLQDVQMPGLDVTQLVERVHALTAGQPIAVILFTAAADGQEIMRASGADDLLRKPFQVAELKGKIEHWHGRVARP